MTQKFYDRAIVAQVFLIVIIYGLILATSGTDDAVEIFECLERVEASYNDRAAALVDREANVQRCRAGGAR